VAAGKRTGNGEATYAPQATADSICTGNEARIARADQNPAIAPVINPTGPNRHNPSKSTSNPAAISIDHRGRGSGADVGGTLFSGGNTSGSIISLAIGRFGCFVRIFLMRRDDRFEMFDISLRTTGAIPGALDQ